VPQIDIIIFIVSTVGNFQRDMSASVPTNRLKTGNDIQAHYLLTRCHEIYMQNKFILIFLEEDSRISFSWKMSYIVF